MNFKKSVSEKNKLASLEDAPAGNYDLICDSSTLKIISASKIYYLDKLSFGFGDGVSIIQTNATIIII